MSSPIKTYEVGIVRGNRVIPLCDPEDVLRACERNGLPTFWKGFANSYFPACGSDLGLAHLLVTGLEASIMYRNSPCQLRLDAVGDVKLWLINMVCLTTHGTPERNKDAIYYVLLADRSYLLHTQTVKFTVGARYAIPTKREDQQFERENYIPNQIPPDLNQPGHIGPPNQWREVMNLIEQAAGVPVGSLPDDLMHYEIITSGMSMWELYNKACDLAARYPVYVPGEDRFAILEKGKQHRYALSDDDKMPEQSVWGNPRPHPIHTTIDRLVPRMMPAAIDVHMPYTPAQDPIAFDSQRHSPTLRQQVWINRLDKPAGEMPLGKTAIEGNQPVPNRYAIGSRALYADCLIHTERPLVTDLHRKIATDAALSYAGDIQDEMIPVWHQAGIHTLGASPGGWIHTGRGWRTWSGRFAKRYAFDGRQPSFLPRHVLEGRQDDFRMIRNSPLIWPAQRLRTLRLVEFTNPGGNKEPYALGERISPPGPILDVVYEFKANVGLRTHPGQSHDCYVHIPNMPVVFLTEGDARSGQNGKGLMLGSPPAVLAEYVGFVQNRVVFLAMPPHISYMLLARCIEEHVWKLVDYDLWVRANPSGSGMLATAPGGFAMLAATNASQPWWSIYATQCDPYLIKIA